MYVCMRVCIDNKGVGVGNAISPTLYVMSLCLTILISLQTQCGDCE